MRKCVTVFLLALCIVFSRALQGFGTAQKAASGDKEISALVEKMIESKHLTFPNSLEEHIVQASLCAILDYYKKSYLEEQWKLCAGYLQQRESLSEALIEIYGRTPHHVLVELIRDFKNGLPKSSQGKKVQREINEYKISYYDEEKPNEDYVYIEYLLKKYAEEIEKYFWNDIQNKKRYQINLQNIKDASVNVAFITDADEMSRIAFGSGATASTSINIRNEGDKFLWVISLYFPYPNFIIASALTHELAHVIQVLSMVDPEMMKPVPLSQWNDDFKAKWIKGTTSAIMNLGGGALNEGMAEFLSQSHNLMWRYGFIDDVDVQLRQFSRKTGHALSIKNMRKDIKERDINKRVLGYQVAHSFFRYILQRFGPAKTFELMASAEGDDDYQVILGTDLDTLDKDWNKHLETMRKPLSVPERNVLFP